MSSYIRPIVVDDRDNRIQYTGRGWFEDSGTQDTQGNFGPTYLRTSHGTNSNDSLSFSFTGTSIRVYGTTALAQIPIINGTGEGTTWDPKWECFIDGVSVGSTKPFQYTENNWVLCDRPQLSDGNHTLTVNVTTMGGTFWFDQLQFKPSPNTSFNNVTNVVLVPLSDPAIDYGPGWGMLGDTANSTTKLGAQVRFNFTGTSLSWLGFVPTELSHNASDATYSIDGGPPVHFLLKGLPPDATTTVYNQVFFNASNLSPSEHSLVVTYLGNGSVTPLVLTHMYVTNVSTTPGVSPGSPNTGPGSTSGSNPKSGSSAPLGAILGGVLGGLSVIALLLLFLYRRKKRREAQRRIEDPVSAGEISPFMPTTFPEMRASASTSSAPPGLTVTPIRKSRPTPATGTRHITSHPSSEMMNSSTQNVVTTISGSHSHSPSFSGTLIDPGFAGVGATGVGYHLGGGAGAETSPTPLRKGQEARPGAQQAPAPEAQVVVQHHQDSGIRMDPEILRVDVPPVYTAN